MHFADTVVARMRELGHPLCAGLDPHIDRIPPLFRRGTMEVGDPETAAVIEEFMLAFLERLVGRVAVVKPQIAFFEQLCNEVIGSIDPKSLSSRGGYPNSHRSFGDGRRVGSEYV